MLTFLVNSFSRNGKHEKSMRYADELAKEIENYNRLYYQKYVFYYYNARVINYSQVAPVKALDALNELEVVMKDKPNAYYEMFIHLNRGILFFKTGRYNDAIRSFVRYYTNEYYKKSDTLFKLRVAITELMMQIESKDWVSIKIRLEQVRKQFENEMEQTDAYAEKVLYEWMKLLFKNKLNYKSSQIQEQAISIAMDKKMTLAEDSQLLNYQAWVSTKIKS
jgi:tetratricopeptide (TPR) repeat protein